MTARTAAAGVETMDVADAIALYGQPRQSKYHNRRTCVDGQWFDSAKEAERWQQLRAMERGGLIRCLRRQVRYDLVVGVHHICRYVADFVYVEGDRLMDTVEDCKGYRTRDYKIKRRLMLALYGITIRET